MKWTSLRPLFLACLVLACGGRDDLCTPTALGTSRCPWSQIVPEGGRPDAATVDTGMAGRDGAPASEPVPTDLPLPVDARDAFAPPLDGPRDVGPLPMDGARDMVADMRLDVLLPVDLGPPRDAGRTCGGIGGLRCNANELCDRTAGQCNVTDATGICVVTPTFCSRVFQPVCGCDRKTYDNDCVRQMAGVAKDRNGPC